MIEKNNLDIKPAFFIGATFIQIADIFMRIVKKQNEIIEHLNKEVK